MSIQIIIRRQGGIHRASQSARWSGRSSRKKWLGYRGPPRAPFRLHVRSSLRQCPDGRDHRLNRPSKTLAKTCRVPTSEARSPWRRSGPIHGTDWARLHPPVLSPELTGSAKQRPGFSRCARSTTVESNHSRLRRGQPQRRNLPRKRRLLRNESPQSSLLFRAMSSKKSIWAI